MKTLYITILILAGSTLTFAQQNKQEEKQGDIQETLGKFAQMNESQKATKSDSNGKLASQQGLDQKKQNSNSVSKATPGKLLSNTASTEEMLASIPNRKKIITNISKVSNSQGLPNTATLEEFKKTIPKN
ncbi:MAG: hypothetical protein J0I88_01685 [Chryseobacterium sp.]|uniref:Uncharacterized protein n=1 Tax=Epilithonimonas pallida TaxID=373671 RepID=A0ABY1R3F9_9FLAO|nr:hypothetical protein [Epilithonimonas pallida]MBN9336546.1 hypothetical protein [Chryseobacterium sp.]OJX32315.1 MAG: hypothetical protein BGO86_09150 [Chryseobacterium sp. 36-9]SMP92020.1 hypothetical protein SAMN05421679_103420 [Epilithonimonas pallida]